MSSKTSQPTSVTATVLGIVGIVAYAATGILYLGSGLIVPGPWIVVLWAIWIAGLYFVVTLFRQHRPWTPVIAVGAAAFWWLFVTVGESLFGWSA
jgi:hypothetical protein